MKAPTVTPHLRLQAAYAYSGMGRALNFSGQRTEAREALRTAVDIRRKLVAEFPDAPGLSQDLAWELRSLAASHLDQKQTEQADPLLKEAESLLSEVVRRKPDFARLTDYRRTLGQTRYLMGRLHVLDSDWDEAEREFRRGVEVYEGLVRDFPANVTHKSELAKFYWFLAISLNTQGRVEEAESIYRKCYDLCVAAGKGGDPRLLGEACLVLTEIHLFKIPADEKKRDYGRARGFAEEAVKHNRTNPVGFRAKSACYLGIAEYRLGNYPQAIESLNQALSLGHKEAVYFLAMAHWRLGDQDRATAYYATALKDALPTKEDSVSAYRREAEELMGIEATSFISRGPRPPEP
jgi:tetratricopeptide (TPR) repeat protein